MNENNPNLTNFSQRMLGWSFCGAQPNTVTDPMPDLRDLYYSIEGCERLLNQLDLVRSGAAWEAAAAPAGEFVSG